MFFPLIPMVALKYSGVILNPSEQKMVGIPTFSSLSNPNHNWFMSMPRQIVEGSKNILNCFTCRHCWRLEGALHCGSEWTTQRFICPENAGHQPDLPNTAINPSLYPSPTFPSQCASWFYLCSLIKQPLIYILTHQFQLHFICARLFLKKTSTYLFF